jgi:hypothetical protein
MNTTRILGAIAAAAVFVSGLIGLQAQSSGTGSGAGGRSGAKGGTTGTAGNTRNATAAKPKFKDLPVNSQFYFLSDTNRSFSWTKISTTTARNDKNSNVVAVANEMLIAR